MREASIAASSKFHDRLAFLDDPGDAVAVLAPDLLVEAGEHLLELGDLALRLVAVGQKGLLQLRRTGRLGQLGQGLQQLLLGVVGVAQLVDECVVQGSSFSHDACSL
jgi:hypothetical protein